MHMVGFSMFSELCDLWEITETKTLSCWNENLWRYKTRDMKLWGTSTRRGSGTAFLRFVWHFCCSQLVPLGNHTVLWTPFPARFCVCKSSLKIQVFCLDSRAGRGCSAWWFTPGISEDVMTWYDRMTDSHCKSQAKHKVTRKTRKEAAYIIHISPISV